LDRKKLLLQPPSTAVALLLLPLVHRMLLTPAGDTVG
jgi:hypothetical protein